MSDAKLKNHIDEAALIREMANTTGFKILKSRFEEKIKKATDRIINISTPDDEVKKLRQQIGVWTEVTLMLKSIMLTGDYAAKILNQDLDSQDTPTHSGQGETNE